MKFVVTRTLIETQTVEADRTEDAIAIALAYERTHDWDFRNVLSVEQVVG